MALAGAFFTTFSSSLEAELSWSSSLALDSESDSGSGVLAFFDFLSLTADLAMSLLFALGV
jgi:hypothetical protein